jgi:hypothetical protein
VVRWNTVRWNIFDSGKADFGGITTNSDGFFVGDAIQKAYIVVDEYE